MSAKGKEEIKPQLLKCQCAVLTWALKNEIYQKVKKKKKKKLPKNPGKRITVKDNVYLVTF